MGAQERVRQAALAEPACLVAELQGRSGCDRQQIDTRLSIVTVVQLGEGQHREPPDVRRGALCPRDVSLRMFWRAIAALEQT